MASERLPKRASRLSEAQQVQIVRLSLHQLSAAEIARQLGIQSRSVRRALARVRATLAISQTTEQERAEAIALYREVQRTAWEAVAAAQAKGRSPAMVLAEIRLAQTRIDQIQGIGPPVEEDAAAQWFAFRATVVSVVTAESPELAARIAGRLLEARKDVIDD